MKLKLTPIKIAKKVGHDQRKVTQKLCENIFEVQLFDSAHACIKLRISDNEAHISNDVM